MYGEYDSAPFDGGYSGDKFYGIDLFESIERVPPSRATAAEIQPSAPKNVVLRRVITPREKFSAGFPMPVTEFLFLITLIFFVLYIRHLGGIIFDLRRQVEFLRVNLLWKNRPTS